MSSSYAIGPEISVRLSIFCERAVVVYYVVISSGFQYFQFSEGRQRSSEPLLSGLKEVGLFDFLSLLVSTIV